MHSAVPSKKSGAGSGTVVGGVAGGDAKVAPQEIDWFVPTPVSFRLM